jgi:hypothetical protein
MMIRAFPVLLLLSFISLLLLPVHGLYFHIVEGSRKCFIEEVPEDVLVVGRYTSPDFGKLNLNQAGYADGEKFAGIKVTVTDPRQDVLMTHDTSAEGKFGFTSVVGGEHVVCLATNTSSWYGQTRNFVSFEHQQRAIAASDHPVQRPSESSAWMLTLLCRVSMCVCCSQRMTLQLDIGENAQDYSEIAKQEHLSGQWRQERAARE